MTFNAILALLPAQYVGYVTATIAICAAVTATVPAPANHSSIWGRIYSVIDFVALNIGHAKSAAQVAAKAAAAVADPSKVSLGGSWNSSALGAHDAARVRKG